MFTAYGGHRVQNIEAAIYVGDLDENVTETILYEVFSQVGCTLNVYMPKDHVTRKHRGFGFVEFRNLYEAEHALRVMNAAKIYGKPIIVEKATNLHVQDVGAKIFLKNLHPKVDETALYDIFSKFGELPQMPLVVRDCVTGASKGYGYVKFSSFDASDAAIKAMDGEPLYNQKISVCYSFIKGRHSVRHGSRLERERAQDISQLLGNSNNISIQNCEVNQTNDNPVPVCANPVYATPVYANPVYANPVYANPVYANPVYANPVYANPVYANPVYANPVYANPVYANPVYTNSAYANPVYTNSAYANPVIANQIYANPVYANQETNLTFYPVVQSQQLQMTPITVPNQLSTQIYVSEQPSKASQATLSDHYTTTDEYGTSVAVTNQNSSQISSQHVSPIAMTSQYATNHSIDQHTTDQYTTSQYASLSTVSGQYATPVTESEQFVEPIKATGSTLTATAPEFVPSPKINAAITKSESKSEIDESLMYTEPATLFIESSNIYTNPTMGFTEGSIIYTEPEITFDDPTTTIYTDHEPTFAATSFSNYADLVTNYDHTATTYGVDTAIISDDPANICDNTAINYNNDSMITNYFSCADTDTTYINISDTNYNDVTDITFNADTTANYDEPSLFYTDYEMANAEQATYYTEQAATTNYAETQYMETDTIPMANIAEVSEQQTSALSLLSSNSAIFSTQTTSANALISTADTISMSTENTDAVVATIQETQEYEVATTNEIHAAAPEIPTEMSYAASKTIAANNYNQKLHSPADNSNSDLLTQPNSDNYKNYGVKKSTANLNTNQMEFLPMKSLFNTKSHENNSNVNNQMTAKKLEKLSKLNPKAEPFICKQQINAKKEVATSYVSAAVAEINETEPATNMNAIHEHVYDNQVTDSELPHFQTVLGQLHNTQPFPLTIPASSYDATIKPLQLTSYAEVPSMMVYATPNGSIPLLLNIFPTTAYQLLSQQPNANPFAANEQQTLNSEQNLNADEMEGTETQYDEHF